MIVAPLVSGVLHMVDFQRFIQHRIEMLQSQLDGLLLQTMSSSPPAIPKLNLSQVHDDHAHPILEIRQNSCPIDLLPV
jgi:hypothetical protein